MPCVLITRPRNQAAELAEALRQAGFQTAFLPVIEIHPIAENPALERALGRLACYDWVIFTSVNGVEVVWEWLERLQIAGLPSEVQVAAIGPKTAMSLTQRGVTPAFVPDEYVAEALLPGLGDLTGRLVLLPRAEIARQALPQAIVQAGGVAHEIAVYQTLPTEPDPDGLAALAAGVDVITLTSPSTVKNFVALARQHGLDPLALPGNPLFACIGPITAQAARQEGLTRLEMAQDYTSEGLVRLLSKHSGEAIC